jgi:hypothetical protein
MRRVATEEKGKAGGGGGEALSVFHSVKRLVWRDAEVAREEKTGKKEEEEGGVPPTF